MRLHASALALVAGGGLPAAGRVLWLAADRITGLADGDPVGTWADLSGGAHDATQVGSARPLYKTGILNGLPGVLYDGTDDSHDLGDLSSLFPAAATLLAAFRPSSDLAYCVYDTRGGLGANANFWRYSDGNGYAGTFRSSRINTYPASPAPQSAGNRITSIVSSAGTYEVFYEGVSQGAQAANFLAGTAHRIGRNGDTSGWFSGYVFEIVAYNRALPTAERRGAEAALGAKWGIAVS